MLSNVSQVNCHSPLFSFLPGLRTGSRGSWFLAWCGGRLGHGKGCSRSSAVSGQVSAAPKNRRCSAHTWFLHILAQGHGFLLGAVRGLMCVCVRVHVHAKKFVAFNRNCSLLNAHWDRQTETDLWSPVVVLNLVCHSDVADQRRVLFTVLGQNQPPITCTEVLRLTHKEHLSSARSHPLPLTLLKRGQRYQV